MQIKYQNILLRDMRESDIDDDIYWRTEETRWADWDAPWEPIDPDFDPAAYRRSELERLKKPLPEHRLEFEVDTAEGVHIGSVNVYCLDGDLEWKRLEEGEELRAQRWALGIDINDPAYWSGGWGTQALTAFVRYHLEAGWTDLYTQTWSGNVRMVGLAEKLGFRECRRKEGIRSVRGGVYDGLTFRLDPAAFATHWARQARCGGKEGPRGELELYIPRAEDLWFRQAMEADPATMAYNAGWDVSYEGYHPDTGCIDLPESRWAAEHAGLVGHEPERFYAFVRERGTGKFVGEVNFHRDSPDGRCGMGVVIHAPFRGRGYGLPALELLLERAFAICGVPVLCNSFEEERGASLAIHLQAGFRRTGRSVWTRFGRPVTLLELELTQTEWAQNHLTYG